MARRKTIKSTATTKKVDLIQKPIQITKTINCVINSVYTIDNFDITKHTAIIHLNTELIDDDIINNKGNYKGIKLVPKNGKLLVYAGKHSLSQKEDITSGILTVKIMEI